MDEKRKIYFVLNTLGLTGGVKVIFEQANLFTQKGYEVHIIHLLRLLPGAKGLVIAWLKKIKYLFSKNKPDWFNLNSQIHTHRWISLKNKKISGYLIATANETADWVNKINKNNIKNFYFIQDYENWTRDEELVNATYKYKLNKIVGSSWLKEFLEHKFQEKFLGPVFTGVDYKKFWYPQDKKNENLTILIMYHVIPKKGFVDGEKVLKIVKNKYPNIKIKAFGAYPLNDGARVIDEYHRLPKEKKLISLYHEADIFLCPSRQEGFTLPPMEAMAARCALVTTAVGGPTDYCINQENSIMVPVGDIDGMVQGIVDLIENPEKRLRLAANGQQNIMNFGWHRANDMMEKVLLDN